MSIHQVRIVAKTGISTEDFDRIIGPFGLKYSRRMSMKATKGIPRHVWRNRHGSVTLVNDEPLELDYVKIELPSSEIVETLLRDSFSFYEWSDVLDLVRSSSQQERALAFRVIAELKYVKYDQELFEILTSAIHEGQLDCSDALFAAGQLSWHQLRPAMEQAIERHGKSAIGNLAWNILHGSEWDR
jgi:hypothetical protein